ncbi:hypothetical protein BS47DRAFT_1421010 [Hydnum rufescens UP504]|uniref:Vacuolar sorting protein n=1 Tax=Hydnum rufescens UP504 TaxID=1448309 RepID=A0A9P6E0T0_9AGAM|nr:hypothetical protein BS47DRAFT_1421010 [Hydnum rufescens UP504]
MSELVEHSNHDVDADFCENDISVEERSNEHRVKDLVELHEQVEASLESFLGTFQKDLSAVSGHISDLQARSKDFDARLRGRRKVSGPLTSLLANITIPPQLALTLLDTPVSDAWIPAVNQLETLLISIPAYSKGKSEGNNPSSIQVKVRAAKDLEGVAEGLRIVVYSNQNPNPLLSLLQPIRTSLTTNLQILQSSLFLNKYLPLYRFLQRNAAAAAEEIKVGYISCAKQYYETGMRRYTRSLGWIRVRTTEVPTLITASPSPVNGQEPSEFKLNSERLAQGKVDGPGVILAYMADDKTYIAPSETIFRSALLVVLDNGSAEYSFIRQFFKQEPFRTPQTSVDQPISLGIGEDARRVPMGSEVDFTQPPPPKSARRQSDVFSQAQARDPAKNGHHSASDDEKTFEAIWKQIFDPVLPYVQTLITSIITPSPPLIPLLTMIRLSDAVLDESARRGSTPLEPFLLGLRFQLWPLFQKQMSENVESLKKLADGGQSGAFGGMFGTGKAVVKDEDVHSVATRYAVLFCSVIALSEEEEEIMLFTSLQRLRQELNKLMIAQAKKMKDATQHAVFMSTMCERLLRMISAGERLNTHPKAQAEVAFWREREEEARRRIASTRR